MARHELAPSEVGACDGALPAIVLETNQIWGIVTGREQRARVDQDSSALLGATLEDAGDVPMSATLVAAHYLFDLLDSDSGVALDPLVVKWSGSPALP